VNRPRELILGITDDDKALHIATRVDLGAHFVGLRPGGGPRPRPSRGFTATRRDVFVDVFVGWSGNEDERRALPRGTLAELEPGEFVLPDDRHPTWEFFDATGRRLSREEVEHPAVAPEDTDPTAEVVDEQVLLLRVARALGYLQAILDRRPELGQLAPGQVITETPHPEGTLAEVIEQLASEFGPMNPNTMPNRGGWLHLLAHAAGVAHR
jgi:hypothetical protein